MTSTPDPESTAVVGPVPAWRLLLVTAMFSALYMVLPLALDDADRRPWLLVGGLVLGALVGVGMGYVAPPQQGTPAKSSSVVRSTLAGLIGTGLILAQLLSPAALSWLLLATAALMAGGAGRAWVQEQRS